MAYRDRHPTVLRSLGCHRLLLLVGVVWLSVSATSAWAETPTLAQCTRLTNPWYGGEEDHTDLGAGRVMWSEWWSVEGTFTDIILMDCETRAQLRFRTAETNMTPGRFSFDRTDAARDVVALHESGARAFATFDRIAADLDRIARDITIGTSEVESCACAARYPALRGDVPPFVWPDLD